MIHLRLVSPASSTEAVLTSLLSDPAVTNVVVLRGVARSPEGDVVLADVAREAADRVIDMLRAHDLHRAGSIALDEIDTAVSEGARTAEVRARGDASDALVWEEIEARARTDSTITVSYLLFMAAASVIAACGLAGDSPVLIVGAMVVGVEYGPVAALCVALAKPRRVRVARAASCLLAGLMVAIVVAFLTGLGLDRWWLPERFDLEGRSLTRFVSAPDALAVIVAVAAGVVGMLSLTERRTGALVGVLVSVTTVPAAAGIGFAGALGAWGDMRGSAVQLGLNLVILVAVGTLTLVAQRRVWRCISVRRVG